MSQIILIVDDDPSVHEALQPILEIQGFEVLCARTLEKAMWAIERETCDLVLADLSLSDAGGKEGIALIEWVRERWPRLPVVLFTALGSAEIFSEARRRGAVDGWSKDIPIGELVRRVCEIGRERSRR